MESKNKDFGILEELLNSKEKKESGGIFDKIFGFLKEKLSGSFGGFLGKIESFLAGMGNETTFDSKYKLNPEKIKELRNRPRADRNVGGDLYTDSRVLELMGIGSNVPAEKVQGMVTAQIERIDFLGQKLRVNRIFAEKLKSIEPQLKRAFEKSGYKINKIGSQCWRCISPHRGKSGPKKLSNHALGFAIDIDPPRNPYRKFGDGEPVGEIGKHPEIIQIFKNAGISWGGDWGTKTGGKQDAMHFEMTFTDIANALS